MAKKKTQHVEFKAIILLFLLTLLGIIIFIAPSFFIKDCDLPLIPKKIVLWEQPTWQKIHQWCALITQEAQDHSLDPELIAAVIWIESTGDPSAISHSGAVGLMQVMASDGRSANLYGSVFKSRPQVEDLKDPEFNIHYGSLVLRSKVDKYEKLRDAIRAYGPSDVGYTYADKVINIYKRIKE